MKLPTYTEMVLNDNPCNTHLIKFTSHQHPIVTTSQIYHHSKMAS